MFRTFFPFGCFGRRGLVSIRLWERTAHECQKLVHGNSAVQGFLQKSHDISGKFSHFVFITDISFVPFAARNNTFGRSTSIKPRRGHEVHVVLTKMRPCFVLSLLGFGVNRAEMSFGFTKLPGLTSQVPLDYTTSTPEPRRTNPLFSSKSAPTKCTNQRDLSVGLVTRTFLDSEFSFLSFETTTHKKTGGKSQHTNMGPNFEVRINKPKVFPKFVIHENTNGLKAVTHLLVARGVCSTFCSSAGVSKELIIESRSWRHWAAAQMRHKGFFTGSHGISEVDALLGAHLRADSCIQGASRGSEGGMSRQQEATTQPNQQPAPAPRMTHANLALLFWFFFFFFCLLSVLRNPKIFFWPSSDHEFCQLQNGDFRH